MAVRAAAERFFFAEEPIARVGRFRRGLAVWTAAYLATQLPHLQELYCRPVLREGPLDRLLGLGPPPLPLIVALAGALLVALGLVALDVGTRRAQVVAAGLFAALFVLDASWPHAYAELALVQWGLVALAPVGRPGELAPRWTTRLMMLQLSAVYVFAGLSKLVEGTGWLDGEAIRLIFGSPRFGQHLLSATLPLDGALPVLLGWSTIALELCIGVGLWHARTRILAAAALVGLHLGIAATMRISLLFLALMVLHLLLFVGPQRAGAEGRSAGSTAVG